MNGADNLGQNGLGGVARIDSKPGAVVLLHLPRNVGMAQGKMLNSELDLSELLWQGR